MVECFFVLCTTFALVIKTNNIMKEKLKIMKQHLAQEIELRGEKVAIKFFRKFYPYYISGVQNASKYRGTLIKEENYSKLIEYFGIIEQEINSNYN